VYQIGLGQARSCCTIGTSGDIPTSRRWPPTRGSASFSPRERQVLQLIAGGASSKQAASVLGVTKRTIDHHRQNLMRKLGLYSVGELTKFAIRHGLTPVDHRGSD
jgi:DNA-binding NarL/FixJ family response regulator